MFTKNIKDTFTANLLNAVSGVLGEAKKKQCSEGCECEACEPEETKEGYVPTNDMPSASDRKTAGKLAALLKRERDAKEKKEPLGVKTEEVEDLDEKRGLWDNIHAKRKRIKAGSGERMRKPGSEGAPSAADFKASQKEEVSLDGAFKQIDELSKATMGRYINKAKDSIDLTAWRQGYKEADGQRPLKHMEKKLSKRHKGIETAVKKLTKEEQDFIDELSKDTAARYVDKASGSYQSANVQRSNDRFYDERGKDMKDSSGNPKFSKRSSKDMAADDKTIQKRLSGLQKAHKVLAKEESEQIDELSKATMGRYINKAATKMGSQGVTAGLKIAADEKSSKNFKDMGKREKGIKLAVNKLTKEEQDFIDSLNDADLEQIDELSKKTLGSYIKKASGAEKPKNVMDPKNVPLTKIAAYQGDSETGHFGKRFNQATYDKAERLHKNRSQGITRAADKLAKEEVEVIDELSNATLKSYVKKASKSAAGNSAAHERNDQYEPDIAAHHERKVKNRLTGISRAADKLAKEEVEVIDELSKKTLGSYVKKAAPQANKYMDKYSTMRNAKNKRDGEFSSDTPKMKDLGRKGVNREDGVYTANKKLAKEELEEGSKPSIKARLAASDIDVLKSYGVPGNKMNRAMAHIRSGYSHEKAAKMVKEEVEIDEGVTNPEIKKAYADLLKTPGGSSERKAAVRHYKSLRQNAVKEEVELDEARGRPKKAGARDFTIHPKTKEKLMHNNPEHVKRIERLQKNGILPKPKTEANQHIIQQLQRAKTSMRGGETINFTHGDSKHVAGTHAAKLLDKYAGMRPNEKEAFQKKIGHSHENLKSEL